VHASDPDLLAWKDNGGVMLEKFIDPVTTGSLSRKVFCLMFNGVLMQQATYRTKVLDPFHQNLLLRVHEKLLYFTGLLLSFSKVEKPVVQSGVRSMNVMGYSLNIRLETILDLCSKVTTTFFDDTFS
jgi:hypothetical protein